jgi:hypothetical protein
LLLIFLRDSNTGVYHFDHQNWAIFWKLLNLHSYFNLTLLCELQSVWL